VYNRSPRRGGRIECFGAILERVSRRSAIRNWVEYAPAWPILKALEWLPLPASRLLARSLGAAAHALTPGWRRIADRNLRLALPEMPEMRRAAVIRQVYQHLARVLLSLARMPRIREDNLEQWLVYEGYEHYAAAHKQGRGVLFLTAHLGNWELSAHGHCLHGNSMNVVGRPLDNPYFDRYVDGRRTVSGNRVIRKQEFGRQALRALRANEAVGVLVDQNAGDDGVFVDFFGHKASATSGQVRIAMRTGTPIVPGFAFWDEQRGICVLRFGAALEMVSSGDKEADLVENTQRCQNVIEQAVREHPDQWLWIHRRWKTRPPGEPDLY